jgi:hypothetical protein
VPAGTLAAAALPLVCTQRRCRSHVVLVLRIPSGVAAHMYVFNLSLGLLLIPIWVPMDVYGFLWIPTLRAHYILARHIHSDGLKVLESVDACTALSSPIHTYRAWLAARLGHGVRHGSAVVVLMPHFAARRDCHNAWPDFAARRDCHKLLVPRPMCIATQQAWPSAALRKLRQTHALVISVPHLIVWRDRHVPFYSNREHCVCSCTDS